MNNPPLSQAQILELCERGCGFSLRNSHAHFENYTIKINKLISKKLVRFGKRLGDCGKIYEAL